MALQLGLLAALSVNKGYEVLTEHWPSFSEGPAYDPSEPDVIYYCSLPRPRLHHTKPGELYRYNATSGVDTRLKLPPGKPLTCAGLVWDVNRAALLATEFEVYAPDTTPGLVQLTIVGDEVTSITTLVDRYDGKPFNGLNDIIQRSDGTILFTDSGDFMLPTGVPMFGVYALYPANNGCGHPEGFVKQVVSVDWMGLNGLALSPDENTLYFDHTYARHVQAVDLDECDNTTNRRTIVRPLRFEHTECPPT